MEEGRGVGVVRKNLGQEDAVTQHHQERICIHKHGWVTKRSMLLAKLVKSIHLIYYNVAKASQDLHFTTLKNQYPKTSLC